ncbi:MCE family protein [Gordonia sp. HY002]|uniref:MCE family protein n=1 Tax=Gordonia zhenghanii TaxID=2911516 RepID=UPI001EF0A99E|nr:MCE family protein [Gordonia zhenghanii]MCF8571251.1 MCE family protein [Gordonia zhenghanii]MCF8601775.1 MCE family protein [Gordonia zhenghanii]
MTGRLGRATSVVLLIVATLVALSGCSWRGLNSLPLPGTHGRGDGAWTVQIEMPDVTTIDRNSEVLVDDIAVGRVSDLALRDGHAVVTVSLDDGVALPANTVAKIGQTTLLGSAHVELGAPDNGAVGRLRDGDTIPIDDAGAYPTTEQTLASVALVLGGGGLDQVRTITTELNAALGGRTDAARRVLSGLNRLLGGLNEQIDSITDAIDSLDDLSSRLAAQHERIGEAIDALAPALDAVADRRGQLSQTLIRLGDFSDTAHGIVRASGDEMRTDLKALPPILKGLADSGKSLTESSRYLLTYPFPIDVAQNVVRGDYANGQVTLDLRLATLDKALLIGTPLEGMLSGLEGVLGKAAPATASRRGDAPPLKDLLNPGRRPR